MSAPSQIVPTDAPSVFAVLKSLSVLDQQAIVRPNNPPAGIAGFLFDIPEDDEIQLRSDVTDHFLEDNTAVADQIALKPEEITLRGLVAEIAFTAPPATRQVVRPRQALAINPAPAPLPTPSQSQIFVRAGTLARILAPGASQLVGIATSLAMDPADVSARIVADGAFLAANLGYSTQTAEAFALARMIASANKSAGRPVTTRSLSVAPTVIPPLTPLVAPALQPDPASLYGMFLNKAGQPPNQTKQARTFAYFYQLWKARQLFTVETPWGFLTDMTILTLRATQDDESRFRSSFSITFKKIRTAGAATIAAGQLAGRAAIQSAPVTQNGTAGKTPLDATQKQSLLFRMTQGP